MKEIEVKAIVSDENALLSKLADLGCVFGEEIEQIDTCYVKNIGPVDVYLQNDHFLRIRKTRNGNIFTYKKPASKTALIKEEHETKIENADQMEQTLILMGYQKSNVVQKRRKTCKYKEYEICLDVVENLGSFIEIEKMSNGDFEKIHNELFFLLMSLGIQAQNEIKRGYDLLMLEKIYGGQK